MGAKSGVVAWFSAVRVFDTEIANFSVVETDGNLNVTMAASEGTTLDDNKISVKNSADEHYVGHYVEITNAVLPADGAAAIAAGYANGDRLYTTDAPQKMYKLEGGNLSEEPMAENAIYYNETQKGYYRATSATALSTFTFNPIVLTHGSFDIGSKHASTLDPDATNESPAYIDKGVDTGSSDTEWLYKGDVSVKTNPTGTALVDVFVAVSWEMTFKYTFAGDSTSVAIYLDSKTSNFEDVDSPRPNFKFNAGETLDTQKGFRIGFYGGYYANVAENTIKTGSAAGAHNFVWGNNTPIQEYNSGSTYNTGDFVEYSAAYYRCNTDSTTGDWAPAKWDAVSEYSETDYALNAYVLHEGAVYKCGTPISDGGHAWKASEWTATGDITTAKYIKFTAGDPGTLAPQVYGAKEYTGKTNLDRVEALAEAANTVGRTERLCVLTAENPVVTVKCAAWYEGTDPNVVSGAAMACLKANMHFYARTVTGAL